MSYAVGQSVQVRVAGWQVPITATIVDIFGDSVTPMLDTVLLRFPRAWRQYLHEKGRTWRAVYRKALIACEVAA